MTPPVYPKRPPYFAMHFARLLADVEAANRIGADGCWLLTVIATAEDKFKRRVDFRPGQLMRMCGIGSEDTFERVRNRVVAAGWLNYTPGRKRTPGTYSVAVPPEYRDRIRETTEGEPPAHSPAPVRDHERIPRTGAGECAGENADPSFLFLSPVPEEVGSDAAHLTAAPPPADTSDDSTKVPAKQKMPRKEPTGNHPDARRGFCSRWRAKYGDDYAFDFAKHGAMLKWMLKQVRDDLPKLLAIFDRFFADDDPFFAADARHTLDRLKLNFNRWLVALPLPISRAAPKSKADRAADATEEWVKQAVEAKFGGIP